MRSRSRKVEGGYVSQEAHPTAGEPADWRSIFIDALDTRLSDDKIPSESLALRTAFAIYFDKKGYKLVKRAKRSRRR